MTPGVWGPVPGCSTNSASKGVSDAAFSRSACLLELVNISAGLD